MGSDRVETLKFYNPVYLKFTLFSHKVTACIIQEIARCDINSGISGILYIYMCPCKLFSWEFQAF